MDEKFLEFWGNFLINIARGKKQTSDINSQMQKQLDMFKELMPQNLFSGFNEWSAMFRKFYGLEQITGRGAEYQQLTKKAKEDFHKSFTEYVSMMGMTSKSEYLSLVEKYEKLKKKCADHEETIKHLHLLLDAKSSDQGNVIRNLQSIVKNQGDLFQNMMRTFSQHTKKIAEPDASPQPEEKKASESPKHPAV